MKPLVPLLLAVLLCACAHSEGGHARPTSTAASYYPLAVGNRWTYQANFLGERSLKDVTIVRRKGAFFEDSQGQALAVDAYGLRDQQRYLLRDPLEKGATWTNVLSVSSIEHYTLAAVGEPCSVPAGNFEGCIRVQSQNRIDSQKTLLAELTFAPNVGIVRVRTTITEASGKQIPQTELKLLKYELTLKTESQ
jgi:hypothetical protein